MKFLGSLFTFAILSISAVFGADINQYDGAFHYRISDSDMKATVVGITSQYISYVVLKPYVVADGKKYYVNQIGPGAFSNTNVDTIVVPSEIQSLNISYNAFYDAKNLRSIRLYTEKVTADESAFEHVNQYINIEGVGARSLANDISKKLLQKWGFEFKQYKNVSNGEFNQILNRLAYYVKRNFSVNNKITYKDNAVVTLALKGGSANGIARAFRILAKNLGYEYHDVHVGSDGGNFSWNYVYIQREDQQYKKWYNLDIVNNNISSRYYPTVFYTFDEQRDLLRSKGCQKLDYMNDWIVFNNEYNYPDEYILVNGEKDYYETPRAETFYGWCVRNRSGGFAN